MGLVGLVGLWALSASGASRGGACRNVVRVGLVALGLALAAAPGFAATKAIRAGTVIDPGGKVDHATR